MKTIKNILLISVSIALLWTAVVNIGHSDGLTTFCFSSISVVLITIYLLVKSNGFFKNASLIFQIVVVAYYSAKIDINVVVMFLSIFILFTIFTINMCSDRSGNISLGGRYSKNTSSTFDFKYNYGSRAHIKPYNENDIVNPSITALGHKGANGMLNQFNNNK